MKLMEISSNKLFYTKPDFKDDWQEIQRDGSPELKQFYIQYFSTEEQWLQACQRGRMVKINDRMHIDNTDFHDGNLKNLNPTKLDKAVRAIFTDHRVQLPIILKDDQKMILFDGNVRLTVLNKYNYPLKAWMIDVTQLQAIKAAA